MSELKVKIETTASKVMRFEAEGNDTAVQAVTNAFVGLAGGTPAEQPEKVVKIADVKTASPEVEAAVVAIYDNVGIPSFMYRFKKTTNAELFGGSDKTHSAFIIGSKEYDEIFISVYPNCEINGKPYSLPYQKPWTNITNDKAAEACFSKGEGWHLITAAEWGLIANTCLKNGTLPHGNTASSISAPGTYHADASERGVLYDGRKTLTGSGPATWTHNHTPEGIHDLCGNVWEMVRGLRIVNGRLQAAENNDAALDIDLTQEGDCWKNITDDRNGEAIRVSVGDGNIKITTDEETEHDYDGCEWQDVEKDFVSEKMDELALYAGEPEAYFYVDSTDGEYFPLRGGRWAYGAGAGVFSTLLSNPRSHSTRVLGFRSAYFKKN